jgi:hypothetical protein
MSFMLKSFTIGVWWIDAPNKPKPFAWTKTAGETPGPLAAHCRRVSDSGH